MASLETFCGSLSDDAQLRIALRLGNLALPVWEKYFRENPTATDQLNFLIVDSNRLEGGLQKIDPGFARRALEKIGRSYDAAKAKSPARPVPAMKGDGTLAPLLVTCLQPLTNKQWDNTLTQSVRLVFTLIFNLLIWIQFRRKTTHHETHIYVSINMSADLLIRESIQSREGLLAILDEYKDEIRQESEQTDWENAFPVGQREPQTEEDLYRKFLGEKIFKGQGGLEVAIEVLRQMREEGKSYWNELEDFNTGISTTYSWDTAKGSFNRHAFDNVVGSFNLDFPMTETEMLHFIAEQSLADLRDSGFEV